MMCHETTFQRLQTTTTPTETFYRFFPLHFYETIRFLDEKLTDLSM